MSNLKSRYMPIYCSIILSAWWLFLTLTRYLSRHPMEWKPKSFYYARNPNGKQFLIIMKIYIFTSVNKYYKLHFVFVIWRERCLAQLGKSCIFTAFQLNCKLCFSTAFFCVIIPMFCHVTKSGTRKQFVAHICTSRVVPLNYERVVNLYIASM